MADMVLAARGLLAERFETAELAQAKAAAESLVGIVIVGEAEAVAATEALVLIATAKRAGKAALDEVLALPNRVIKAVREDYAARMGVLEQADYDARRALAAYQERTLKEAQERQREAQEEANRVAADLAAQSPAEDAPPPMIVSAAPARPSMIRGGQGGATMTSRIKCELVNHHDCDPSWLKLDEALARDYAQYEERRTGERVPTGKEQGVVASGVRFWREESISVRTTR